MELLTEISPSMPAWPSARREALPRRSFAYRGVPCRHSPVELSLYLKLLFRLCPASVVDLHAGDGGSALFFADQCRAMGLATRVIAVRDGDGASVRNRSATLSGVTLGWPGEIDGLPRPLLVVADKGSEASSDRGRLQAILDGLAPGDAVVAGGVGPSGHDPGALLAHQECAFRMMCEHVGAAGPGDPPVLRWLQRVATPLPAVA